MHPFGFTLLELISTPTMKLLVALILVAVAAANVVVKREDCADNIKHCARLADSEDGCNPSKAIYKYMALSCQLTCGICSADDAPTCANKLTAAQCSYLVNLGACEPDSRYYHYMIPNCQEACGECAADEQDMSDCSDQIESSYCAQFISAGGTCTGNKYLLANCEKTCGACAAYNDDAKYCVDALVGNGNYQDPTDNCSQLKRFNWCVEAQAPSQYWNLIKEGCRKTCDFC